MNDSSPRVGKALEGYGEGIVTKYGEGGEGQAAFQAKRDARKRKQFIEKEGDRINMAAINKSQKEDKLTPMENRDLTRFMAEQLEEKCE